MESSQAVQQPYRKVRSVLSASSIPSVSTSLAQLQFRFLSSLLPVRLTGTCTLWSLAQLGHNPRPGTRAARYKGDFSNCSFFHVDVGDLAHCASSCPAFAAWLLLVGCPPVDILTLGMRTVLCRSCANIRFVGHVRSRLDGIAWHRGSHSDDLDNHYHFHDHHYHGNNHHDHGDDFHLSETDRSPDYRVERRSILFRDVGLPSTSSSHSLWLPVMPTGSFVNSFCDVTPCGAVASTSRRDLMNMRRGRWEQTEPPANKLESKLALRRSQGNIR